MSHPRMLAVVAVMLLGCTHQSRAPQWSKPSPGPSTVHRSAPIYLPGATRAQRVSYRVRGGLAFRHGDVMMGPAASVDTRYARPRLRLDRQHGATSTSRPGFLWPRGVIPYEIDPGVSQRTRRDIAWAAEQLTVRTRLTVRPRMPVDDDYLVFTGGSGCSSYVGREGGPQDISVDGCGGPTIIHEIMHAAGFEHEQCRPDRDAFVRILHENIEPGMEGNFERVESSHVHGAYDYDSIMHYDTHSFSRNGRPTIMALAPGGERMGLADDMSDADIAGINALYADEPPAPPPAPGLPGITIRLPGGLTFPLPAPGGAPPPLTWPPAWPPWPAELSAPPGLALPSTPGARRLP